MSGITDALIPAYQSCTRDAAVLSSNTGGSQTRVGTIVAPFFV